MHRWSSRILLILALVGSLALWVGVFAAGMLINSESFRRVLQSTPSPAQSAPRPVVSGTETTTVASTPHPVMLLGSRDRPPPEVSSPPPENPGDPSVMTESRRPVVRAFASAVLLYGPLNAAILTIVAAFIGGCTSRLAYRGKEPSDRYLTENPVVSAARGFAIYLVIMSGAYVIGVAPFGPPVAQEEPASVPTSAPVANECQVEKANERLQKENEHSQGLTKFACTLSLFAFIVGYSPRKFEPVLGLLPGFGAHEG
jgi:hypothetical protein